MLQYSVACGYPCRRKDFSAALVDVRRKYSIMSHAFDLLQGYRLAKTAWSWDTQHGEV